MPLFLKKIDWGTDKNNKSIMDNRRKSVAVTIQKRNKSELVEEQGDIWWISSSKKRDFEDEKQMQNIWDQTFEPITPNPKETKRFCQIQGCSTVIGLHNDNSFNTSMSRSLRENDLLCKANYGCLRLGCNRRVCENHKTKKWVMETKHRRKGCVRPTVCVECESKVRLVSVSLCFLFIMPILSFVVTLIVLVILYKVKWIQILTY